ncbi:DUF2561 family protein [Mycobacterium sp. MMS18-G62]
MPYDTDTAGRSRFGSALDTGELDRIDRILLAACAAIWLAALGAGVAATVALVDLGSGHPQSSTDSDTPWLLYTVIGISAAVIIGAVPLLLRARRAALEDSPPPTRAPLRNTGGQPGPPVRGVEAPTEKLRALGTADPVGTRPGHPSSREPIRATPSPLMTAVDQLWLRCAVIIACAMGVATIAIGVATYLMAVDSNTASWVLYGLAALITVAMPAVPWYFLRQLRDLVEGSAA